MASLVLYAITLGGTFIFDDVGFIREDSRLHEPGEWHKFAYESYNDGVDNLFRPLVSLSYAAQYRLSGNNPHPMHAVNWLLAAIDAALVAELARRLAGQTVAYLAGLAFAVHPLHVEAVAYLSGRPELMCALGVLGAIILLLHRPFTIGRAVAVTGCLLFAMLSKEQGLMLPLIIAMLPLCLGVRRPNDERERQAAVTLALLLCWFTAGYIIYREHFLPFAWNRDNLDWTEQPMIRSVGMDRVLMPFVLLGRYVSLLFAPLHLTVDYGERVISSVVHMNDPYLYIGIIATVLYLIILYVCRRNGPALFCLLAAGVFYGLVGNIVTLIGTNFNERLMYLPSAFILIALAMAAARLPRKILIIGSTILFLAASVRSFTYAREWNDRLSFYEISSARNPQAIRLRMLVVSEEKQLGKLEEAARDAEAERKLLPQYVELWIQSADVAIARGRFDEADDYLRTAMQVAPGMRVVHWQLKVIDARKAAAAKP